MPKGRRKGKKKIKKMPPSSYLTMPHYSHSFPDFVVNNNVIIECTFWHDAKQRAEELHQKIRDYKELGIDKRIIVTLAKRVDECSKLFENSGAIVITINSLRNLLAGKLGGYRKLIDFLPMPSQDRAQAS